MVILFIIGIVYIHLLRNMLTISFDFNEDTKTVTNVKVVKVPSKYDNVKIPIVELTDNKLILSPLACQEMGVDIGDRIVVNYIQKNNEVTLPVIGKSEVFSDPEAGNKLTRSGTVSFKGTQQTILSKYGQLFRIAEVKDGMFGMFAITEADLQN